MASTLGKFTQNFMRGSLVQKNTSLSFVRGVSTQARERAKELIEVRNKQEYKKSLEERTIIHIQDVLLNIKLGMDDYTTNPAVLAGRAQVYDAMRRFLNLNSSVSVQAIFEDKEHEHMFNRLIEEISEKIQRSSPDIYKFLPEKKTLPNISSNIKEFLAFIKGEEVLGDPDILTLLDRKTAATFEDDPTNPLKDKIRPRIEAIEKMKVEYDAVMAELLERANRENPQEGRGGR